MFKYKGKLLSEIHPVFYFARVWQKRLFRMLHLATAKQYSTVVSDTKLPYRYAYHSSKLFRQYSSDPRNVEWQSNKIVNLQLTLPKINQVLIKPGEVFSFWKLIGRPTRKKGYLDGMQLSRGVATSGIGGGLCQMSNLLNWLLWHSPLEIIQRSNHSFDPFPDSGRILPFGSGAAVFWNYVDLQALNPTDDVFQITVWIDRECLHGEIRSLSKPSLKYHIFERNHYFTKRDGFWFRSNEIWRNVYRRNIKVFIKEELLVRNFSQVMYEPNNTKLEADEGKFNSS